MLMVGHASCFDSGEVIGAQGAASTGSLSPLPRRHMSWIHPQPLLRFSCVLL